MGRLWPWVQQSLAADGSIASYSLLLGIIAPVVILALALLPPPVIPIFSDRGCLQCTNE
ncbi:MAG TPA: hypothetical protein VFH90_05810 [Candidatus Limnocylindria bacterium]|nr:hypothetical protein [Candidatus Limnocylindria bacterium]